MPRIIRFTNIVHRLSFFCRLLTKRKKKVIFLEHGKSVIYCLYCSKVKLLYFFFQYLTVSLKNKR